VAIISIPAVYPILDTATLDRLGLDCVTAAEALIEGGAKILQVRHKTFWSRETFALSETLSGMCSEARVPFVINDRADYAAILKSALHLGQGDLPKVTEWKHLDLIKTRSRDILTNGRMGATPETRDPRSP